MSSYSAYHSHRKANAAAQSHNSSNHNLNSNNNNPSLGSEAISNDNTYNNSTSRAGSPTVHPEHPQPSSPLSISLSLSSSSSTIHSAPPTYTIDYTQNTTSVTPSQTKVNFAPTGNTSVSSTDSARLPSRAPSPNMSSSAPTRWKRMRLNVMKMATVERLQLLWALLALFGTMSWLAMMPAYAFRNKFDAVNFKAPSYTFFLIATIFTSLSAIWQSLCPFLVRQSQRALLPRVINHPATQTATIIISVLLTIFNFFSWMALASDKNYGAKTDCWTGRLSDKDGYVAQCRGVNVAIVFDVVVFLLWIPISLVIVCGTIDRGLWWWGEDDGWAQGEAIVGGSNMMSEEEFDMKIGLGGSKKIVRRQTVHPENLASQQEMIQQPKPAFVTPIASQFRSTSAFGLDGDNDDDDDDFTNFTPSSYRKHHQQRQQRQRLQQQQIPHRQLSRRGSNTSLSSRLSSFFGAGWGSGSLEDEEQPPMPAMPSQYRQQNSNTLSVNVSRTNLSSNSVHQNKSKNNGGNNGNRVQRQQPSPKKEEPKKKPEPEPEPSVMLHGAEYTSQWHSRRYDDWS